MKTEVKFRELPEKVREFLLSRRVPDSDEGWSINDIIKLSWLHNLPEWKDAANEERLAYAEWRYPVGTKYRAVNVPDVFFSNKVCESVTAHVCDMIRSAGNVVDCGLGYVYSDATGWAELISEPEEKPSIKDRLKGTCVWNESVEMGAEIIALYTEAGFINHLKLTGTMINLYHGVMNKRICTSRSGDIFTSVLTIDKLRQIVRGSRSVEQYEKELEEKFIHEASPSAQQEFVKANPGMQHVEEPKAGDMVEFSQGNGEWNSGFYIGLGSNGMPVVEYSGLFAEAKHIRLPQKSEVRQFVTDRIKQHVNTGNGSEIDLGVELVKWGQANPGKI